MTCRLTTYKRKYYARHLVGLLVVFLMGLVLYGQGGLHLVYGNIGRIFLLRAGASNGALESAYAERAEQWLQCIVAKASPVPRSAWRSLGFALHIQEREAEALQAWENAGGMATEFVVWGNDARWAERFEEAIQWYTLASRLQPAWSEPWHRMAQVYQGQDAWDSVVLAYQEALQRSPEDRDLWYELGTAYAALQEWHLALQAFEKGLNAKLGDRVGLSNLYYQTGYIKHTELSPSDLEGAWRAYDRAIVLDDYPSRVWQRADTFFQQGLVLASLEKWSDATVAYQRALEIDGDHYRAYLYLASALWKMDQGDLAKETLRQAIEIAPEKKHAYRLLGNYYEFSGEITKARNMYNKALEIDPEDQTTQQALERLGVGSDQ